MTIDDDFRIFRIRGKDAVRDNHSQKAWEMGQVGIWYGAWLPEQLDEAINKYERDGIDAALKYVNSTTEQKGFSWKYEKSYIYTCKRFRDIEEKKDWVVVYFDQTLHIGQLKGGIKTDKQHELNKDGELFHYRSVINPKSFPLAELPDVARLIPQTGRSNVHEYNVPTYSKLLEILVEYPDPKQVTEYFKGMDTDDWLDFLSDAEWESLCLGYLIIEYNYVPTGLLPGRTLMNYDLVGKTIRGIRILAQCKKSHDPYAVSDEFRDACDKRKNKEETLCFWCSYGGWDESSESDIKLVDKECIKNWLGSKKGKKYLNVFRPNPSDKPH